MHVEDVKPERSGTSVKPCLRSPIDILTVPMRHALYQVIALVLYIIFCTCRTLSCLKEVMWWWLLWPMVECCTTAYMTESIPLEVPTRTWHIHSSMTTSTACRWGVTGYALLETLMPSVLSCLSLWLVNSGTYLLSCTCIKYIKLAWVSWQKHV